MDIKKSVVRILNASGTIAGTGFIISSDGLILTCSHVLVADQEAGMSIPATVCFNFLGDHEDHVQEATVLHPTWRGIKDGDFVVLKAMVLPEQPFIPLKLASFTSNEVADFYSFGFPVVAGIGGMNGRGTIEPFRISEGGGKEILQLNSTKITSGFSGAPVIEEATDLVVGMVSSITPPDVYHRNQDTAFATPIEQIAAVYSAIELEENRGIKARFELETSIVERLNRLVKPLPLRILIATSEPVTESFNVNSDKALAQDIIGKVFISSGYHDKCDVELYHLIKEDVVEVIAASHEERKGITEACPPLESVKIIVCIVWHNLGFPTSNDSYVITQLLNRFSNLKANAGTIAWVYRKEAEFAPAFGTAAYTELISNYSSTDLFIKKLKNVKHYGQEGQESFDQLFGYDLSSYLDKVLPAQDAADFKKVKVKVRNPFKGLRSYTTKDAALFFGRLDQVSELINKVQSLNKKGILVTVGASGSGKSSLLRAGLFHQLAMDAIPGSRSWKVLEFSISKMEPDILLNEVTRDLSGFINPTQGNEGALKKTITKNLRSKEGIETILAMLFKQEPAVEKVVFFIDQFEELFTLVEEGQRALFIEFLLAAAAAEQAMVLLAMRNDYFHKCAEYHTFHKQIKDSLYSVLQPDHSSLHGIINRAVSSSNLKFEDQSLPSVILDEIRAEAGMLPLLSYAMEQLVDNIKEGDNTITYAAYRELGGIQGIIQRQADGAIAPLTAKEGFAENFSFLFRQLITIEQEKPTKKTAWYDDSWPSGVQEILDALTGQRLLYRDDRKGRPVVEVAHEALLSNWATLQNWIESSRADMLLIKRVETTASDWKKAREMATTILDKLTVDHKYLWPHERLQEVYNAIERTGSNAFNDPDTVSDVKEFIVSEHDRLVSELNVGEVSHQRRAEIGDRLAQLGDKRPGVSVKDCIPDIIWCKVNPGTVTLRIGNAAVQKTIDEPFYIAKYPVTLAQFNVFAGNVEEKDHVYQTEAFWQDLDKSKWFENKPYPQTGNLNRPAQYISWYQAVAFCRWLTQLYQQHHVFSADGVVALPTEWEWQLAASGGKPDYNYPWGAAWNANLCSSSDGIRQFMAVGLYPQGQSPTGAMDMCGNMYEWCLNKYDDIDWVSLAGDAPRATRGGAYFSFEAAGSAAESLNIHSRLKDNPGGYNNSGARIGATVRPVCYTRPEGATIEEL